QFRFLNRVWRLVTDFAPEPQPVLPSAWDEEVNNDDAEAEKDVTASLPQWQQILQQGTQVLSDLPDYVGKFVSRYKKPIITLGLITAGAIAVYLTITLLDAVNHIPLLEPIFQLIGFGYATWFAARNLVLASTRQKFLAKLQTFKPQITKNPAPETKTEAAPTPQPSPTEEQPTSEDTSANQTPTTVSQSPTAAEKELRRAIHTAIKEITEDLEGDYQFNTGVSELMKLSNALNDATCKDSPVYAEGIETLIRLLAPFAPHIAEELWHSIGHTDSVHSQVWPKADPDALVADEITLVIQIMGKTRGTIKVPSQADRDALEKYARESEFAQRFIEGREIKKVIVVPGKLVNFVLGK
ncbi:MAG TPA: CAAD domain-containing protein, partial [Candidatus Sericytochromatia bacterium]